MNLINTTQKGLILFLSLSLAAILTALAFEHLGGYRPCPLCLQERYAYYLAIPLALTAFLALKASGNKAAALMIVIAGLGFLVNSGLGLYHSGVEWQWWPGPGACSGSASLASDTGSLFQSLETIKVIRCDEAPWRMFGLSFAGWNMVISLFLALLAARIFKQLRRS